MQEIQKRKGIDKTKKPNLDEIRANARSGRPSERYEREIDMSCSGGDKTNKEIAKIFNLAVSTVVHDLEDIARLYGSDFVRARSVGSKPSNKNLRNLNNHYSLPFF